MGISQLRFADSHNSWTLDNPALDTIAGDYRAARCIQVSVRALHGLRLLCRSQIHHEAFRDLTLARREMKNRDVSFLLGAPFPLTGKGRDKGAREPTKPITPTFVLPRQGEGIRAP